MTMDDVHRIFKHWAKYPPLRDLVAAFIGFEIPSDEPEDSKLHMTADDFKRLMSMTGGRIPGMD
jgi:hypothetical protein